VIPPSLFQISSVKATNGPVFDDVELTVGLGYDQDLGNAAVLMGDRA